MASMLLTCPESAHLEEVDLDAGPLGIVVERCSAYGDDPDCPRTCAARLDRRRAKQASPVGRVLEVRSCLRR